MRSNTLTRVSNNPGAVQVIHIDNMEYGHVRILEKLGLASETIDNAPVTGPLSGEYFAYVLTPLGAELWNEVRGPISVLV